MNQPRVKLVHGANDPDVIQQRLREYDRAELDRKLSSLDGYDAPVHTGIGRPRKVLPRELARRMVADLVDGKPVKWVWRKYRKITPFSSGWLFNVWHDGRLRKMADGEPI